jgi:alpha-glucoside transport system substrate-binding protein
MMHRAVMLALLLCLAAAGCGSVGTAPAPDRVVEVFGPYVGIEADRFAETLRPFERESGVTVRYIGSVDFVADLRRRAGEDSDPPDVAVVPQPGLVRQLATDGVIVRPGSAVADQVDANYSPTVAALGQIDSTLYGVPWRIAVKSLVWYRPAVFAAHDWKPPRTLAALDRLAAQVASDGELTPWCLGLSAGSATGWPATDWVEDLLLRTAGVDVYRGWVAGSIPFRDPRVAAAFGRFHGLVLASGRVAGGLAAVVSTSPADAVAPLFAATQGCAMLKQADFATAWMPNGSTIGPDGDVDWFLLPGKTVGRVPILVGGDQIVQFRHSPDIDALMRYLAGPDAGTSWVRRGGFLSPKSTIPEDAYPAGYVRKLAQTVRGASTIAFDGSDEMPPDIGSGLLWREITRWAAGAEDYATLASRLDAARAADTATSPDSTP